MSAAHTVAALTVLFGLAVSSGAQAQPKRANRTPPLRKINHNSEKIAYRLTVRPGVPAAGTTVTVDISLAEILGTADPIYGNRRPIDDARLEAILVGPATAIKGKSKLKAPPFVETRRATRLPDAGSYGVTFTPPGEGIYGLHLVGSTDKTGNIEFSTNLSFGVWPLPEIATPKAPKRLPASTIGNPTNGKLLCARYCRQDLPDALPAGAPPEFLQSAFAAGHDDATLLQRVAGADANRLSAMEKTDLLFYLHSLHVSVGELFPDAASYMAPVFTINEHGRDRLDETARIKLGDAEATGRVFVVYKGKTKDAPPALVNFQNRVARDRLKKNDRLGYIVFCELPGEKKVKELAIAMGREPTYPIINIVARDAGNHRDPALQKILAGFAGQGEFNDAGSLLKGPRGLRDKLLPVYLRAAELATMYYADELEFTAFDGAFD